MTTTQENVRPLPLIGQSVGQAQATLHRLLNGILAGSGTSYQAWLGLQRLNALGGQPARDAYERDVRDWLQLDGPAAARLADELIETGLAEAGRAETGRAETRLAETGRAETGRAETGGGVIRMTEAGCGLRQRVLATSAQVTGPVLATLDRGDLEVTIRTLDEITRRVRATFGTEES
jgi:DNA-binding MarR family transcriptional regulator